MRVRVRLVYGWWWLPLGRHRAITIFPFIFFRDRVPPAELINHELIHVAQVRRLGWLKFYALYLWYSWRYGYHDNPFEVEARGG